MTLKQHTIASGIASIGFFYATRSWMGTLACFTVGVLIDCDHALDFILQKKRLFRNYQEVEDFCLVERAKKVYLIFHSYELLAVLWISYIFVRHFVWLGVLVGATIHLMLDQIFNEIYPLAYFLAYRRRFGFPHEMFFKEEFIKKYKPADKK